MKHIEQKQWKFAYRIQKSGKCLCLGSCLKSVILQISMRSMTATLPITTIHSTRKIYLAWRREGTLSLDRSTLQMTKRKVYFQSIPVQVVVVLEMKILCTTSLLL